MIFYYLDASVWVKRYCEEVGSSWTQDFFTNHETITCASLGYIEVMATLARKRKAREIDSPVFDEKVQELEEDWEHFFQLQMTDETIDIARDFALKGADAIHLASALWFQKLLTEQEDTMVFITSDQELKGVARLSSLEVLDPEAQERRTTSETDEDTRDTQQ